MSTAGVSSGIKRNRKTGRAMGNSTVLHLNQSPGKCASIPGLIDARTGETVHYSYKQHRKLFCRSPWFAPIGRPRALTTQVNSGWLSILKSCFSLGRTPSRGVLHHEKNSRIESWKPYPRCNPIRWARFYCSCRCAGTTYPFLSFLSHRSWQQGSDQPAPHY